MVVIYPYCTYLVTQYVRAQPAPVFIPIRLFSFSLRIIPVSSTWQKVHLLTLLTYLLTYLLRCLPYPYPYPTLPLMIRTQTQNSFFFFFFLNLGITWFYVLHRRFGD
ncbi:hypothetical protein GGR50DRAFT_651291 [Xylaria sp. CBS 124048]|nr:hypothetical protein GGR50DRAFT_651291 [Xylaria sp. CBS 124048]